jgi:hypothetical protein
MPPLLEVALWLATLLWLIRNMADKDSDFSPTLWVPLVWMFMLGFRSPYQWLGQTPAAVATVEGSLHDAQILTGGSR